MIGESRNVVVLVRQVRNKGIAPLEDIKEMIEPLVKREKKFEILSEKVNQAKSGATSIEDIAKKLNVQVQQLEFINFGSPNLPGIGPEPKVVGTIFGTEKGKISRTVKGDMGVYVVQTVEITDAPPTDDYSVITFNQRGFFINRVNFEVYNALLKKADVRDNKIRFY
jgi:peptidyl-prolyl cis-trans isomerase D